MFLTLGLVVLCALTVVRSEGDDAQSAAADTAAGLYATLRNVAFPDHQLSDGSTIDGRFLMLMPGKVLNYFDYYPGADYTNFIRDISNGHEAVVPPHVMEKWFDLADVIPSPNPMNAQDTGKSMASVYASILQETKLKGLRAKTDSERAIYNQALDYLNQSVADPDNLTTSVPRLTLYERYRDLYNDKKLEMEDSIDMKRRSVKSLDYELWFQRHYPSLQAKVDSAYTKWLIFGEKETVELYITYMDTGSSGTQLEEARMALRRSGVSSLDRTRTIYPVSFEPSDWYKYLLPENQAPSRDQLLLMQGKINSKIHAINAMINAINTSSDIAGLYDASSLAYTQKSSATNESAHQFMNFQINCLVEGASDTCDNYEQQRNTTINDVLEEAKAFSKKQVGLYLKQKTDYIASLQNQEDQLQAQFAVVEDYLSDSTPYLGGLIDSSPLAISNLTDANKDSEWLQFDYDYSSYKLQENKDKTVESIKAHGSARILFFHIGADYSFDKTTTDSSQMFDNSNLRVKGELLRVNIKRPWFKPEVFEIPDLDYHESRDGIEEFVSPGMDFNERTFFQQIENSNTHYKLPEFATSFLLARNIELEFSDLQSDTVTSTLSQASQISGGGGFGGFFFCFHASASRTKTKDTSHVQVQKTATGMTIKIPGAQIIGYYTKILPRFPLKQ